MAQYLTSYAQYLAPRATAKTVPIYPVDKKNHKTWLKKQSALVRNWVAATEFGGSRGEVCLLPSSNGELAGVLVGVGGDSPFAYAALPKKLPKGRYRIDAKLSEREAEAAALGWALGCYRFDRYKERKKDNFATLVWPTNADRERVSRLVEGISLTRDLITTPAGDMGPEELAAEARKLGRRHKARVSVIVGDALLQKGYPAVHAVGRASSRAPRLIDLKWGNARHKKLTLVGKGVCFDSGGLDLKSASGMKLMKKDMGGAATILGLAHAIMHAGLKVRLRVLIPAVENSVSGNAMRPLDVLETRKGISVEVGNTDAEGRLILCDALAEADRERPDLIIDMATLTGAARVALGARLPALFSSDDKAASEVLAAGVDVADPLWRLPLHDPYRPLLDSKVADTSNISNGSYGGAITAALFLSKFIDANQPWVHIDTMAYNLDSKPGRPAGGEALGLRALYTALERRYG
ncbi:MAG: leucyl aminopeptidase family protein [Myxococcota bacterium]